MIQFHYKIFSHLLAMIELERREKIDLGCDWTKVKLALWCDWLKLLLVRNVHYVGSSFDLLDEIREHHETLACFVFPMVFMWICKDGDDTVMIFVFWSCFVKTISLSFIYSRFTGLAYIFIRSLQCPRSLSEKKKQTWNFILICIICT